MNPDAPIVTQVEERVMALTGTDPQSLVGQQVTAEFQALRDRDEAGTRWCEEVERENADLRQQLQRITSREPA